jgi:hypothetical protein
LYTFEEMKKFDLSAYGVMEMSQQEMLSVDGGNIFADAWNAICDAAGAVWDWICGAGEWVGEHCEFDFKFDMDTVSIDCSCSF